MRFPKLVFFLLIALITGTGQSGYASLPADSLRTDSSANRMYRMLNIVQQKAAAGHLVRVAVIDCGFRLSHQSIRDYIFTNGGEIPGNFQDDDKNGFVDDVHGWDISDDDPDVSVPQGKEDFFYHGTYIAGIISAVFQKYFGNDASHWLEIIPVKVLPDQAKNSWYADGYKGIRYATDMGADIICCAWSGGIIGQEEKSILNEAISRGIMIISSAGNFSSEKAEAPSSFPGVFCVAAIDQAKHKCRYSNFGTRIDICAPGDSITGPHPLSDNAFIHESGTSAAAALMAGCAAVLKSISPGSIAANVYDALRNTATPVDSLNLTWCGKLGSGLPDLQKAVQLLINPGYKFTAFSSSRPEGKIWFTKKKSQVSWNIRPAGAYKGLHISMTSSEPQKPINLYTDDSLWYHGPIGNAGRWLYIPGNRFRVELQPARRLPKNLVLDYYMETIDSATLYCKGTQFLEQENGVVEDGSGAGKYAGNCSCKWQIAVSAQKRVRIEFQKIDTQPNVDYIWIYEGTEALPENLLAKFSGTGNPPVITSSTNKVLVWFISDGRLSGEGWEMKYTSVNE